MLTSLATQECTRLANGIPVLQVILLPSGVQTKSLNKLYFVQMGLSTIIELLGLDNKFKVKYSMKESTSE